MSMPKEKRRSSSSPLTTLPTKSQDGRTRKSTSPPQEPPAPFVFVDGQRHRQDRGTRTLIRTHVMRNFLHQNEDNQGQGASESSSQPPARLVVGQRQKFKLTTKNLEPVKPARSRSKLNAPRGKNAQSKPRRPGEGAFQISIPKSTQGGEPVMTAEVPADAEDDFSWLMESLEDDVDQNLFTFGTLEENPDDRATKLNPIFTQLQPWEQQIQDLPDAISFTSPIDIVGLTQTRLDPFNSLPIVVNPSTEVLIDRFQSTFVASWCPVSPTSGWFSFAITDPALFHSTLFHWAAHKANAASGIDRDSPEILSHKLEAMRLVNERLGDPEQELKDETIAAVACLANVETSFGSLDVSHVHMAGLEKMIGLRGGIENLGFNGLLQRLIHWVDAGNSTLTNSPLRFPAFKPARVSVTVDGFTPSHNECPQPSPSLWFLHSEKPCPYSSNNTEIWGDFISRDVLFVFDEIHRLNELLENKPRTSMDEVERMNLSDSLSIVERKSLSYSLTPTSARNHRGHSPETDAQYLVSECCSLAALIYVHLSLRGVALSSVIIERLAARLKSRLECFRDLVAAWYRAPKILTWVLVTGAIASSGREERSWFVPQLADLCQAFGLRYWEDLREWLRSFLFLESGDETRVRTVWDEVEAFMTELEALGVGKNDPPVLLEDWLQ